MPSVLLEAVCTGMCKTAAPSGSATCPSDGASPAHLEPPSTNELSSATLLPMWIARLASCFRVKARVTRQIVFDTPNYGLEKKNNLIER